MRELIGKTLSHYRIVERIGAGGMGVVFLARDEHLDRDVAVKVLPAGALADDTARRHFRKEAHALSKLNHPNVETVHDFDSIDGIDFLVMEHIPGDSLRDRVAGGPLADKEVSRLGIQLAQGLVAAHEHGIVHRDLKPDNLRVTPDGRLKILDFGLAKLLHSGDDSSDTITKTTAEPVTGTLPYMPPEQLLGQIADVRSDIYSAGAVLYEAATGERPFAEAHGSDLVAAIIGRAPILPHELRRGLAPALEAIILKSMDKNPAHRYQSARELLVDLERVSTPTSVLLAIRPRRQIRPRQVAVAGAVLAAALAGAYFVVPQLRNREPNRAAPAKGGPSIAVLYFQNLGTGREDDSFAAGMTEDVITSLSQIEGLRVLSRGAVERYRGKSVDPRAVGKELGVEYLLEGSVRKVGGALRVTAQLIQTADGYHVWAKSFDGSAQDVFAVQDTLASRIAADLRVTASGAQQTGPSRRWTDNSQAYAYYLAGREAFRALDMEPGESVDEPRNWFQRALSLDPNYAPALVGLARLTVWEWQNGRWDSDGLAHAMRLAETAQSLDSTFAPAMAAEAGAHECSGLLRRAESCMRRAVSLDRRDGMGHATLARLQRRLGRRDESVATVRAGLEIDPFESELYSTLAAGYLSWGAYSKAEAALAEGFERLPRHPKLLELRAAVLIERRRFDEALAILAEILRERPDRRQTHIGFMQALGRAKRRAAVDSAAHAVILRWRDPHVLRQAGLALMDVGMHAAAESLYRAATRNDPKYYPAWRGLAESIGKQGRDEEAEQICGEILRRWPRVARAHSGVAEFYVSTRKPSDAVQPALRATRLGSDEDETPYYWLGLAYHGLGRNEDAARALRMGISLRPDSYWNYNQLMLTLQNAGKFEAAAAAGESALLYRPDLLSAMSNLGGLYFEMGKLHRAASLYERALEVDSTESALYVNLGEVYRVEGRPQRALQMNARAADLDTANWTAPYNIALIAYAYLRDYARVREAASQLRRRQGGPESFAASLPAGALRFLGRVEELQGRPERARTYYIQGIREIESVLRTNPNEPDHLEESAYLYACAGQRRRAREQVERLVAATPGAPERMISAACVYSLLDDTDQAVRNVRTAVERGYRDKLRLSRDPDLDRVRGDAGFRKALASIE